MLLSLKIESVFHMAFMCLRHIKSFSDDKTVIEGGTFESIKNESIDLFPKHQRLVHNGRFQSSKDYVVA